MKTLKQFEKSEKNLEDFLQPLDRIDWFLYEFILCGYVAPSFDNGTVGQAGEAEKKEHNIYYYRTVMQTKDRYFYLGILPEFKQ